jgi:hypothetical protein
MDDTEEAQLIKLSQQGSAEAFNTLIERYRKEALNIAFRMLGNLPDAEDVCQTAGDGRLISLHHPLNGYKAFPREKGSARFIWLTDDGFYTQPRMLRSSFANSA